jgi:hypothetical protein
MSAATGQQTTSCRAWPGGSALGWHPAPAHGLTTIQDGYGKCET